MGIRTIKLKHSSLYCGYTNYNQVITTLNSLVFEKPLPQISTKSI